MHAVMMPFPVPYIDDETTLTDPMSTKMPPGFRKAPYFLWMYLKAIVIAPNSFSNH